MSKVRALYVQFSQQEFGILHYEYQVEIGRELSSSLIIWLHDVAVKETRQSGKTEKSLRTASWWTCKGNSRICAKAQT